MPLSFPTQEQIIARMRADVADILPGSDPTLENSLLDAIITSAGSRISDLYLDLNRLLNELFPQTATGDFLDFFGEIFGVVRLPATAASGNAVFNGTLATAIPLGTEFSSTDGILYTSTAGVNISALNLSVTSLTRSGTTATATFASAHGIATGLSGTISGAVETDYNGTFVFTAISATELEYTVAGSPTTPATGTIELDADIAIVPLEANDTGADGNRDSGSSITPTTTIVGLTTPGFADFNGLVGGADIEDDDSYRGRIILERSSLEALFNSAQIEQEAKTVAGVTRVLVKEVTPSFGQVTILFVRDDDPSTIIPDAGEVAEVKVAIIAIKPAHTADDDVIVTAPTPVTADFIFTALSPDTSEMRDAITSNLTAFFREQVNFEEVVEQGEYESVIFTTIDPTSGAKVESFTLTSPAGFQLAVSGITRSGATATATFGAAHGLVSGMSVVISGADQAEYNGRFTITVTSTTALTYTVTGTPTTPATGTIVLDTDADIIVDTDEIAALGSVSYSI